MDKSRREQILLNLGQALPQALPLARAEGDVPPGRAVLAGGGVEEAGGVELGRGGEQVGIVQYGILKRGNIFGGTSDSTKFKFYSSM